MPRFALGVLKKLIHGSPVLNLDEGSSKPHLMVHESEMGLTVQLCEHFAHASHDGKPLMDFPGLVKAHADHKNDKIAINLSGHSFPMNHGDLWSEGFKAWQMNCRW